MSDISQTRNHQRAALVIKRKMLLRRVSVRGLAAKVGHHESVVSKAINHGKYPRVRQKIAEALA